MTWDWWRADRGCPGREGVVGARREREREREREGKKDKQHRLVACSFVTIYITSSCPPVNSNKLNNKKCALTLFPLLIIR